jgi:hypothetical protein
MTPRPRPAADSGFRSRRGAPTAGLAGSRTNRELAGARRIPEHLDVDAALVFVVSVAVGVL